MDIFWNYTIKVKLTSISQTELTCTLTLLFDKECSCLNGGHWMSEDVAQDQNPKFVRVNSRLHSFGRGRSNV